MSGEKILLVEDDAQIRKFLRVALEAHGFVIHEAIRGGDGVAKAATEAPDLVVLDLGLPDFDGKAFIQKLTLGSTTRPAIVAVTGEKNVDKEELRAMGADQVLFKPFSHEEILKVAERLTRSRKSTADTH